MSSKSRGRPERAEEVSRKLEAQGESPSDFMRARRPELFSDSEITRETGITREMFEYHLDTLTSRKQETQFEHFCRRLSEKEICPNLRPQTGPTGGGDSKVDSETYPVADSIALRWYEGLATGTRDERWAFAFSTKKDWKTKARSDVKAAMGTGRGYRQVVFITSQFAKDKARAKLEDELARKYGVRVVIHDRLWIVKCVFEHDRQELAATTLGMNVTQARSERVLGPRDVERERELRELEEQIEDPDRYQGVPFQFVEDCLRAALLARALERPRAEIEGRFDRAERVAEKADLRQQRLRVIYNRAWTAAWWFDDLEGLNRLYEEVEALALGTHQADDLELVTNLWTVLSTSVLSRRLDQETARLTTRTARLRTELERVASDKTRPNNALQARTSLVLMDIPRAMSESGRLAAVLGELRAIVGEADGLVAYDLETLFKIIREMGERLPDNDKFDALLEVAVRIMGRRVSRGEAGRTLLGRGFQKLRGGRPYDAIRFFGRAWQKLAVREHREELITALLGCGLAYQSVGLLWAARANVLAAANQALSGFKEEGKVTLQALSCVKNLVWLEIELGRVACALQWMGVASAVAYHLGLTGERAQKFNEECQAQDQVLAILFLKAGLSDLGELGLWPAVLERLGLDHSWMALLYALGYEDYLRTEGWIPEGWDEDILRDFFEKWAQQPAAADLPNYSGLIADDGATLHSRVLGCDVTVRLDNDLRSLFLGEQILAALEGLLATSIERPVFPHSPDFRIRIHHSDEMGDPPRYKFEESRGDRVVEITYGAGTDNSGNAGPSMTWLRDLVLQILPRIALIDNLESYAQQVFGEEAALGRALNFSNPSIPVANILGDKPKLRLSDWESEAAGKSFPLRRDSTWGRGLACRATRDESRNEPQWGEGEPPKELTDLSGIKHSDLQVVSLINLALWDRAGWRAVLYLMSEILDDPPIFGLAFSDREAARAIFSELRKTLGKVDREERLRVSVITGVQRGHPSQYRVVIGSSPKFGKGDSGPKRFVVTSRVHQMEPESLRNLEGFLTRYERVGRYFIVPAYFPESADQPEVFYDLYVGKRDLVVRPAWQVGEHDPDLVAVWLGDDPVIPLEVEDAPVSRLLERRRGEVKGE